MKGFFFVAYFMFEKIYRGSFYSESLMFDSSENLIEPHIEDKENNNHNNFQKFRDFFSRLFNRITSKKSTWL